MVLLGSSSLLRLAFLFGAASGSVPGFSPDPKPTALQLVSIEDILDPSTRQKTGSQLVLHDDTLRILRENLAATKADRVTVLSVVGAYRTGKSFLLELMRGFLDYYAHLPAERRRSTAIGGSAEEALLGNAPVDHGRQKDGEVLVDSTRTSRNMDFQEDDRQSGGDFAIPAWLSAMGPLLDDNVRKSSQESGESAKAAGFPFAQQSETHTHGIMVWPEPFLFEIDGGVQEGRSSYTTAVILMDTQGAFDGRGDDQAANLFGLASVLSSKVVYNMDRRMDSNTLSKLAWFGHNAADAMKRYFFSSCGGRCLYGTVGAGRVSTSVYTSFIGSGRSICLQCFIV